MEYALYSNVHSKYIGADGVPDEAAEVWQKDSAWGDVTVIGLTDFVSYTFKAKARDELDRETAFSSDSVDMTTFSNLDPGALSDEVELEVTPANVKVMNASPKIAYISGNSAQTNDAGTTTHWFGDIILNYYLQSYASLTGNSVLVEWSEDGTTWATCTEGSGGDGITGLPASNDGTLTQFSWDSYTDAGASELKDTVYLRVTPSDTDATAGTAITAPSFGVNNRPAAPVWVNVRPSGDGYPFDKDTTPTFRSIIAAPRGGGPQFPRITFYDDDATTQVALDLKSGQVVTGWRYETAPNTWVNMTGAGIPSSVVDGVNRVEITVQPADALSEAQYFVNGRNYEVRDRG